jgi:PAS domain S-box-containing protein
MDGSSKSGVDRTRHEAEEEQRSHAYSLLLALSQAASLVQRARTVEEVCRAVGDALSGLGLEAVILTLTDDREHLALRHLTFEPAIVRAAEKLLGWRTQDVRLPLAKGSFYERIVAEGLSTFRETVFELLGGAFPHRTRPLVRQVVALLGLKQAIYAPLTVRGEAYGLLIAIGDSLTESDALAIGAFAGQASITLENVQLYHDAQREAEVLQEAVEQYRSLAESLGEVVYRADPKTLVATYVNRAVESIYGYTTEEWIEDPNLWVSRIHPDDRERVLATFTAATEKTENVVLEYRIIRKDGQVRWVEDRASWERDRHGTVRSLTGLVHDVTERKETEEKLQAYATQLEASNRELQDFAYIASHDLREPLRKVQAFGERLQARYGDVLDERGIDYLQRMNEAARRMEVLIDSLLTLSRVQAEALPFVPVDLAAAAREVVSDLEVRIQETGARVLVGELPTVDADPVQMRELLQNLIGNALKFHRAEEPPVVQVHGQLLNDEGGDTDLERRCRVLVRDNSIGFDERYLDRIFRPFQRLHGRDEYEGVGMGLAICHKIVERHGGTITARSAPGQGATFIVTLPVRQPKGADEPWGSEEHRSPS